MLLSILLDAASFAPGLAAIAASIAVIGAALGIGKIGQSAMEAMARQPEAASKIQSGMIIAGALVEGATLFAIVVCLLAVLG
ncbi:MAG: ATP synthase F0 subunit C [Bacteroidales bacterium]|nr:ATP synthase F0 subunit C [Bacteroidales bacterium]